MIRQHPPGIFRRRVDEAHEMEDVASDYFGQQISNFRFEELRAMPTTPCA